MTTPSSGQITFTDVASTELGFTTPYNMSNMYGVAAAGGQSGLMYHNLNMAPGNATTAKVAIYDPYNALSNEALTNWYNYSQDIGMVMTYLVTNNSSYDVSISVAIWDSTDTAQGTIFNGLVNATSNTGTQTVNTGLLSQSASMASGYRVAVDGVGFSPPPGPGQTFSVSLSVASASDTDGVGASTTRTTYGLGGYTEYGPNFPPPPPPTPYTATKATDTSGNLIPCNKRTTISITIS
jgi:hypothetical protein